MRAFLVVRAACIVLAAALAALGVAGAFMGGDDGTAWGFFLSGVAVWGLASVAGTVARRGARAA